jgi:hypothetical protein
MATLQQQLPEAKKNTLASEKSKPASSVTAIEKQKTSSSSSKPKKKSWLKKFFS